MPDPDSPSFLLQGLHTELAPSTDGAQLIEWLRNFPWQGFERSFKLSREGCLWDRFLVGIQKPLLPTTALTGICTRMGMPPSFHRTLLERLPLASQILFAFEQAPSNSTYKVYLEFWEQVTRELKAHPDRIDPRPLHLGLKWDPANPARCALATYTCYPLLPVQGILRNLATQHGGKAAATILEVTQSLIQTAADRVGDRGFIYLDVEEEGNPRRSFDINLYKSGLTLGEIRPHLLRVARSFALDPVAFEARLDPLHPKRLGHLAGGLDRRGNAFMTTYFEDDPGPLNPHASGRTPTPPSPQPGRNDPCPCGSGRKYKKCCGANR